MDTENKDRTMKMYKNIAHSRIRMAKYRIKHRKHVEWEIKYVKHTAPI
jgi:hypothetical protein